MNSFKLLILVSTVTLLGACGSKKSAQPNMVGKKDSAKVTVTDEEAVFTANQCETIKRSNITELCESLKEKIKADDRCKETLAISFIAKCEGKVDSSEIADYLNTLKIEDSGEVTIEDADKEVVEVNPEDKETTITGDEFSIVTLDIDRNEQNDVPVTSSVEIQHAIDAANDAAAATVTVDDVDTVHVVYIPDLSDELTQVQVQSQPAVQVSTVENTETKTVETRIETINDEQVQHISQRDNSLSLEEDATNKCLDLYKRICKKETRGSVVSRRSCERTYKRKDLDQCVASATVRRVN